MQHPEPNDGVLCQRRAILFMGISVLPFLNLKAKAFENLASDKLGMFDFIFFLQDFDKFVFFYINLAVKCI